MRRHPLLHRALWTCVGLSLAGLAAILWAAISYRSGGGGLPLPLALALAAPITILGWIAATFADSIGD